MISIGSLQQYGRPNTYNYMGINKNNNVSFNSDMIGLSNQKLSPTVAKAYVKMLKEQNTASDTTDKTKALAVEMETSFKDLKSTASILKSDIDGVKTDEEGKVDSKTADKVMASLKSFVTDYNDTVKFLNENEDKSKSIDALSYSFDVTKYSATSLSKAGLTVKSDGSLLLDETKAKASISSQFDQFKLYIGGNNSGLIDNTMTKVNKGIKEAAELSSKSLQKTIDYNNKTSYNLQQSNKISYSNLFNTGNYYNYFL